MSVAATFLRIYFQDDKSSVSVGPLLSNRRHHRIRSTVRVMILTPGLRQKMLAVCDQKIASKGTNVGVSFYAFFANKNTNPKLLMEAARWWIEIHELDHFEKAIKIKAMLND